VNGAHFALAGAVVGGVVVGAVVGASLVGAVLGGSLLVGSALGDSLLGGSLVGSSLGVAVGSSLGSALADSLGLALGLADPLGKPGHDGFRGACWPRPLQKCRQSRFWPQDEPYPFSFAEALSLRVGNQKANTTPAATTVSITISRWRRVVDRRTMAERCA
jgi:hypothetical protein